MWLNVRMQTRPERSYRRHCVSLFGHKQCHLLSDFSGHFETTNASVVHASSSSQEVFQVLLIDSASRVTSRKCGAFTPIKVDKIINSRK